MISCSVELWRFSLREELQRRFSLTLDLDKRFKLIAYLLALGKLVNEKDAMSSTSIRQEATEWWSEGFEISGSGEKRTRSISQEDFDVLLDEMVGLGILRCDNEQAMYRLRSPNVVSLLGTTSQILEVLDEASDWDSPPQYDPDTFRSPISNFNSKQFKTSYSSELVFFQSPLYPIRKNSFVRKRLRRK